jgi:hypothetical protein
VIGHQLLGQGLVAREGEAARVAAGIRHLQQLQVAHHVLIEHHDIVKRFHQVEGDGRLELFHRRPDRRQVVVDADDAQLVAQHLQGADDVVFHAPFGGLRGGLVDLFIGGLESLVDEREDALRFHRAIRWRPLCR